MVKHYSYSVGTNAWIKPFVHTFGLFHTISLSVVPFINSNGAVGGNSGLVNSCPEFCAALFRLDKHIVLTMVMDHHLNRSKVKL